MTNRTTQLDNIETLLTEAIPLLTKLLERKKRKPRNPHGLNCPPHVKPDIWANYVKMRTEKGVGIKQTTYKAICTKLMRWKEAGLDLDAIIQQSIDNGWTGLFEPKAQKAKHEKPDVYSQSHQVVDFNKPAEIIDGVDPYGDMK